eukprot:1011853-Prorocentrum_minimum.AAC.1
MSIGTHEKRGGCIRRGVCTGPDSIRWSPTTATSRIPRARAPRVSSLVWYPGRIQGQGVDPCDIGVNPCGLRIHSCDFGGIQQHKAGLAPAPVRQSTPQFARASRRPPPASALA